MAQCEDGNLSMQLCQGRAGHWRRNLKGDAAFSSFVPADLQSIEIDDDAQLAEKRAGAELALDELRKAHAAFDEEACDAFTHALLEREVAASWELSSNRMTAPPLFSMASGDAAPFDISTVLRAPEDADEIGHLMESTQYAMDPFDDLPISRRLLTRAHFLATQGPRYEKKYPGEVRRSPNWMGEADAPLSKAKIVFPVDDDLDHALSRLEQYIHYDERDPHLVKIALAHYQFEVIHPFIDANGRMGRLLSNLMLIDAEKTPQIALPLSEALNTHASTYYGLLELVETKGAYEEWVAFFMDVIREASLQATEMAANATAYL